MRLSERQGTVLRALVRAYVGAAEPVGSSTLARTLPVSLSSASIRSTMTELAELGLVERPHPSAGRVPTETGLRLFVDELLEPRDVVDAERRAIAHELDETGADRSLAVASLLLSERTGQLGFAVLPRLDRVVLRHVSLIRVASDRVLAVLVSQSGVTYQRAVRDRDAGDQPALERIEAELNRQLAGHTLPELRRRLEREAEALRERIGGLAAAALVAAVEALAAEASFHADLLLAPHGTLIGQPEFHDPERVRELVDALETREAVLAFLDRVLERPGVRVTFGGEVDAPPLRDCAVVSAPCGGGLAVLGVLGPSRMDYARVIPLVGLLSDLVAEKLSP